MAALFIGATAMAQSANDKKVIDQAQGAKEALLTTDNGLSGFFDNSVGYVIFPNVGKGGFIIGGASGNGVLYENGVAKGMVDLKKINVGLQAGGQAIIEVIFFENEAALDNFKTEEYKFSAEASAVAVESGVAVNAKFHDGVAVFAMPKGGLMADASVGGQKFTYTPFSNSK